MRIAIAASKLSTLGHRASGQKPQASIRMAADAGGMGAQDVGFVLVADVRHVPRLHAEHGAGGVEEPRVRLREPHVVRVDDGLEPVAQAGRHEHRLRGSIRVGDGDQPKPPRPQRRQAFRHAGQHLVPHRHRGMAGGQRGGQDPIHRGLQEGRVARPVPPDVPNQLLQVEAADARSTDHGLPTYGVGPPREGLHQRHPLVVAVDAGGPEPGPEQGQVGADERAPDVEEDGLEIPR